MVFAANRRIGISEKPPGPWRMGIQSDQGRFPKQELGLSEKLGVKTM